MCNRDTCLPLPVFASWVSVPASVPVEVGHQAVTRTPSIETAKDRPFKGAIMLTVDATDVRHKIFTVHETIPVQSEGALTLLYPQWEGGSHAATASVADLAGLRIRGGTESIPWRRDPFDVHAFHISLPKNVHAIDVEFQYVTRPSAAFMMPDLIAVQWHRMLLYPSGWFVRNISVVATLNFPPGIRPFSSLESAQSEGNIVVFKPATLEELMDSPVYAGRYFRQYDLDPGASAPVHLDIVAEDPKDVLVGDEEIEKLRVLVTQTRRLFDSTHFRRFEALVSLSDRLSPGGGIEHFESAEINLPSSYFGDVARQLNSRDLIAHEFVHSWNGRFRQPEGMRTPTPNVPMRTDLLWVYEGQTEFWGRVLASRSELRSRQETLDKLAMDAAFVEARRGRSWKSLADSNYDPLFVIGRPIVWRDWQRREDYYAEGVLLWLDVDARIRELTGGRRSLDDFARAFFGINDKSTKPVTYTFEELCRALAAVAPFGWDGFLRERLETHDDANVLDGLTRHGWRLVYSDEPTETFRQDEDESGVANLAYSIGLTVTDSGLVKTVSWHGSAFEAGLAPDARIRSINGQPYRRTLLEATIQSAASFPVQLIYDADGRSEAVTLSYRGTLRYPRLERIEDQPDTLSVLLKPLP